MPKSEITSVAFNYLFVIEREELYAMSPFQGFAYGVMQAAPMMELVSRLPTELYEPALSRDIAIGRRMAGETAYYWTPVFVDSLSRGLLPKEIPFWILLCPQSSVLEKLKAWISTLPIKPLVVGYEATDGVLDWEALTAEALKQFAYETLQQLSKDSDLGEQARELIGDLDGWKQWVPDGPQIEIPAHSAMLVNRGALTALNFNATRGEPFKSSKQQDYVDAILTVAKPLLKARAEIALSEPHLVYQPHPDVIVAAPSVYQGFYKERLGKNPDDTARFLEIMRKQTKFSFDVPEELANQLNDDKSAVQAMFNTRKGELEAFSGALALSASSSASAVIRVPPAVNRISQSLGPMAVSARAGGIDARRKLPRLFGSVQDALVAAIGKETIDTIASAQYGVRLISDVPLEWMPIGELPLCLHTEVSRLTATPGNLLVEQLRNVRPKIIPKHAFSEILVVSSFTAGDPIGQVMQRALGKFAEDNKLDVKARITSVNSVEEFVAAVNAYDGAMMVFDGHGSHDEKTGVGALHIGSEAVDVWRLAQRVRVPPIVVLSACDTLAIDRSHASVGNGFLALGAEAVLSTLLPVQADHSSVFIARLLYRISEFVAIASRSGRSTSWSEIVTGLLKMTLVTDWLKPYMVKHNVPWARYREVASHGNLLINTHDPDWVTKLAERAANDFGIRREAIDGDRRRTIAMSDVIRYTHIGNPQNIMIVDDKAWEEGLRRKAEKVSTAQKGAAIPSVP